MKRECKDGWIQTYLASTEGQESPTHFHLWVALSVLAATVGRHVSLPRGYYELIPNLYVIIVAVSAELHKSTAVRMGRNILDDMNKALPENEFKVNVFSQKLTPQALLHYMAEKPEAQAIAVCEELTTFLDVNAINSGMDAVLLELYDNPSPFVYTTLKRGDEVLHNASLCLLGATTPTALKKSFPLNTIGEGLTSRINFVYGDRPRAPQAHPRPPEGYEETKQKLIADLVRIRSLDGEFRWGKGAWDWYEAWYNAHYIRDADSPLDAAYWTRRRDFVLKLAMLVSISYEDTLELTVPHLEEAVNILSAHEHGLPKVEQGIKITDFSNVVESVYNIIEANGEILHADLLRKVSYYLEEGATTFNAIIFSLKEEGRIEQIDEGRRRIYRVRRFGL